MFISISVLLYSINCCLKMKKTTHDFFFIIMLSLLGKRWTIYNKVWIKIRFMSYPTSSSILLRFLLSPNPASHSLSLTFHQALLFLLCCVLKDLRRNKKKGKKLNMFPKFYFDAALTTVWCHPYLSL